MMTVLNGLLLRALAAQDGIPNPDPQAPTPELGQVVSDWVGYAKYFALAAGMIGLFVCALMMAIGRRNRSHMAGEGLAGVPWVMAGITLVALAFGIVTQLSGVG